MGFLWDLMQQSQISEHRSRSDSLEVRVEYLEQQARRNQELIHLLITRLDEKFGEDIDGDGRIGK